MAGQSTVLAAGSDGGIIGAELATVVIGGLVSSTFLTLIVVPVIYTVIHVSFPGMGGLLEVLLGRVFFQATKVGPSVGKRRLI